MRKREWFDDESFWRLLYGHMFPPERIQAARQEVERALALARPRGKAALDLCCGPGRVAIALARRGFAVTGVDRTRFLLDRARARARSAKVEIEWVRADMRDFVRPEAFDVVFNMFTSFGYFDAKSEDITVLRNIHASLKPGGKLLMELVGKEIVARIFQRTTSDRLTDGSQLVQHHRVFDGWSRMQNEWILIRKGRARSFRFHHTLYSGQELADRLKGVGFGEIQLFGDLEGREYGVEAERLVVVARKP
jgi:SAM-dependent methyltransferase